MTIESEISTSMLGSQILYADIKIYLKISLLTRFFSFDLVTLFEISIMLRFGDEIYLQ
jgi:hypothetical protein